MCTQSRLCSISSLSHASCRFVAGLLKPLLFGYTSCKQQLFFIYSIWYLFYISMIWFHLSLILLLMYGLAFSVLHFSYLAFPGVPSHFLISKGLIQYSLFFSFPSLVRISFSLSLYVHTYSPSLFLLCIRTYNHIYNTHM